MQNKSTIILDAKDKTGRAFATADSNIRKLDAGVAKLTGAFALLAGGGAMGAMIKNTLDAGDKIQKLGVRLGATTEELSQLEHVAKLSGVSFETMTMGLQRMTRRVAEAAQGTGEAKGALKELGLEATQLNNLGMSEKFKAIAQAIQSVKNPADRVRLAMKLFDSEGVALVQTMGEGAAGIHAMMQEADQLGLTLSQAAANDMAAANDAIAKMDSAFDGLMRTIGSLVAGPLTSFLDGVRDILTIDTASQALEKAERNLEELNVRFGEGSAQAAGMAAVVARLRNEIRGLADVSNKDSGSAFGPGFGNPEQQATLDFVAQYQDELEELGRVNAMTAREKAMHTAEQKFLNAAEKAGISNAQEYAGLIRIQAGQIHDQAAATKIAAQVESDLNSIMDRRQDIFAGVEEVTIAMVHAQDRMASATARAIDELAEENRLLENLIETDLENAFEDFPEIFGGAMEEGTSVMEDIWGNTIENMQREFANTIYNEMLDDSLDSFGDFADALVNIWKRMIAEMVSAWITSGIAEMFAGNGMSGFSLDNLFSLGSTASNGGKTGGGLWQSIAQSAAGQKIAGWFGGGASTTTGLGIGANPATAYVPSGGVGAAGGGGMGGGAAAGGAILAAMYALGSFSNSSQRKMQQHYQNIFDTASFKDSTINGRGFRQGAGLAFSQAGYNTANIIEASGATYGGMNRSAFAADGTRFEAITDGIEKAREALAAYTPEIEAFHKAEMAAMEETISGTMRRDEVESALTAKRKENAEVFVASQSIAANAADDAARAIIDSYGSIDTKVEEVARIIEDGFISSAEAAAAGLDAGAVGMIASLNAVRDSAGAAARAVSSISSGGRDSGSIAVRGQSTGRGEFATGGIARGPASGYRPLLHGNEAVVPLGNGDRAKFPVIIQGDGELSAEIRDLSKTLRRYIHAQNGRGVRAA